MSGVEKKVKVYSNVSKLDLSRANSRNPLQICLRIQDNLANSLLCPLSTSGRNSQSHWPNIKLPNLEMLIRKGLLISQHAFFNGE